MGKKGELLLHFGKKEEVPDLKEGMTGESCNLYQNILQKDETYSQQEGKGT